MPKGIYPRKRKQWEQRPCSADGCDRPASPKAGFGLCFKCYRQKRLTGGVGGPATAERFWAKVNKDGPVPAYRPELGPCAIWTAGLSGDSYGKFNYPGGQLAHRFAYELLVGPIPAHLVPDHLCRTHPCVKTWADERGPAHIELVTQQENLLRGETFAARNAAKTHCPHGHEYTPANTYINSRGSRECRVCRLVTARKGSARYRAKRKEG